jgi:hypothetical protein
MVPASTDTDVWRWVSLHYPGRGSHVRHRGEVGLANALNDVVLVGCDIVFIGGAITG